MGYQTPFMILNDAIHMLKEKKYQKKFCEDLYNAAIVSRRSTTISIGNHCNPVKALVSKHADCSRIIYCGQNSFFEIDNLETKDIKDNQSFYKSVLGELDGVTKRLKQKIKEANI